MKKLIFILILILSLNCYCEDYCNKDAISQMSKIIANECGSDSAIDPNLNFFMRITTGGVILNNAYSNKGDTIYNKMLNFTNSNYAHYSSYKNMKLESKIADPIKRSEIIYTSALVLSGKYTLPKNMIFQAADYIVKKRKVWTYVPTKYLDVYFGYSNSLSNTDIFGNNRTSDVNYYKELADSYKLKDYSFINLDNVCSFVKDIDKPFNINNDYIVEGSLGSKIYKENNISFSINSKKDIKKIEYKYDNNNYNLINLNDNVSINLNDTDGKDKVLIINFKVYYNNCVKDYIYSLKYNINTKYRINYYIDNDLYKTEEYNKNSSIKLIDYLDRSGYIFNGWYLNNTLKIEDNSIINSNMDLYAKYDKINSYNVIYYVDNKIYFNKEYYSNSILEKIDDPIKDNYNFIGWFDSNNIKIDDNYIINSDLVLYAKFDNNYFKVDFIINNKLFYSNNVNNGSNIVFPNTKKLFYKFDGWYLNGKLINNNYVVNNNIVLIGYYSFNYTLFIICCILFIISLIIIIKLIRKRLFYV